MTLKTPEKSGIVDVLGNISMLFDNVYENSFQTASYE